MSYLYPRIASMNFLDARLGQRFWNKVIPEPNSGCWIWTAATNADGYGRFRIDGRKYQAHRVAYEASAGRINEGHEIDHTCRNTLCVNPAHLEQVTHLVNVRRGRAGMLQLQRTHCPNGHAYDNANTKRVVAKSGNSARQCATCARNRSRIAMRAKRATER